MSFCFFYLEFDFACVVCDVETPQGRSSEVTPRVSLGIHARRTASVQTASVGTKVKDGAKILKNELRAQLRGLVRMDLI